MPRYNKLVRDNIPQIIDANGKKYASKIIRDEEYINELKKKSFEELQEYMDAVTTESALEELADVLEVIHALAVYHGSTIEKVEEIRKQKAKSRGGFKKGIFLKEVDD
ncbi:MULTISPECIES: nucleoside triphosphate pyrophosphohydrolase [unclassified Bacillus (in: firmicutes)]|uniref:nucleoside triphosphate pyrophosphohydrolase n=1 Tax=unclassified Bacillus (in: firmicutes) TaxID=185979 RepID=UPI0008DF6E3E|nr:MULTISPECIES: nucleoside triphosphate pyrophosphohydrolase [unclassified Bacillus (in: firmicutes)]SFA86506.1 Predicted house-cleaning noncanonical NTP pyrophosphatase, all-alpha NTP-PPase (MazG) superfamily [Bacillus sp. UNCCL13]SFQ83729.1 Predicted house-cleaning noncanonical NTP pyrophosphatase, all-alpha NTP-PPase (MazG) superfamily [Bacillus sp. cl95]